jgi:hypothetical protein
MTAANVVESRCFIGVSNYNGGGLTKAKFIVGKTPIKVS